MQTGEILAGKYKIAKRLGEGGEGSVYLAIHLQTEMFWAIKEIPLSKGERTLCHELQMMKRLKNRHLPQIIDVLQEGETVWLVMEHVRGIAMDQKLKNGRVLSAMEVMDVAEQVTDALCYLESRDPPVCHLDIKPSNLIRRPDGLIKLVDFGSAWKEKAQVRGTGTDGYAAPEQYPQSGHFPDARSDIYGLGATLYRMSAGKKWSAKMRLSCVPNCSKEMSDLIRKCLEEDPQERFQSAFSLKNALNAMRRRERLEKGRFRLLASLAMAFPACALCLQILPSMFDLSADEAWDYGKLIREAGVVSVEESREYYRRAVFLAPERPEAYLKYLSDAQMDGIFSEDEETFLRDTLHQVRPGSDLTYEELLERKPEAYAEMAFQTALAYWYNCPRDDSRRIALGWFEKAVGGFSGPDGYTRQEESSGPGKELASVQGEARETEAGLSPVASQAMLYLEMGKALEEMQSPDEEGAGLKASRYWQALGRILEMSREGQSLEDPVMQLKFCRESLYTMPFLAGNLARAGVGSGEQFGRIQEIEELARRTKVPKAQKALNGRLREEIRQAGQAAREAVQNADTKQKEGR